MARIKRRSNKHHVWWPRTRYKTPLERQFRELQCQIVEIDISAHDLLHRFSEPPKRPTTAQMADVIERHQDSKCACFAPAGVTDLNAYRERRREHGKRNRNEVEVSQLQD